MEKIFNGIATAIITPMNEDCSINYSKLEELTERQISNGLDSIVVCGTTGEASTLSEKEHLSAVKCVYEKASGRVPVIAGTGSNDTAQAIRLSQQAEKIGVQGLLSVVPYYNTPSQDGICQHFYQISKSVKIPIILYNIPSRTGREIKPETVLRLIDATKNIAGIKECVFENAVNLKKICRSDFSIYAGNDDLARKVLDIGCSGVISTVSNIVPDFMVKYIELINRGDANQTDYFEERLLQLLTGVFQPEETNPGTTKALMNYLGYQAGPCRLPVTQPIGKNMEMLVNQWNKFLASV